MLPLILKNSVHSQFVIIPKKKKSWTLFTSTGFSLEVAYGREHVICFPKLLSLSQLLQKTDCFGLGRRGRILVISISYSSVKNYMWTALASIPWFVGLTISLFFFFFKQIGSLEGYILSFLCQLFLRCIQGTPICIKPSVLAVCD